MKHLWQRGASLDTGVANAARCGRGSRTATQRPSPGCGRRIRQCAGSSRASLSHLGASERGCVIALPFWRPGVSVLFNVWKGSTVKITLDSNESLDDALRVVGAMYNVELAVLLDQRGPRETVTKTSIGKAATKSASVRKEPSGPKKARSSATGAAKRPKDTKRKPVVRGNGSPGNAEVRLWAKQNGMTVKDRGRLPASILAAYRGATST